MLSDGLYYPVLRVDVKWKRDDIRELWVWYPGFCLSAWLNLLLLDLPLYTCQRNHPYLQFWSPLRDK